MNRALALLTGALLVTSACDAADNTVADAAAAVVEDLLPRAPEGYTPYLAPEWQIPTSNTMEPLPAEVLEQLRRASGLPVAERGIVQNRDSSIVVLYLFRPVVVRSDSVRVLAGWMGA